MKSDIKDYIINNFKNDDEKTIRNAIEESINENDEIALPGLGIFFALNWLEADEKEKNEIIKRIQKQIKEGN